MRAQAKKSHALACQPQSELFPFLLSSLHVYHYTFLGKVSFFSAPLLWAFLYCTARYLHLHGWELWDNGPLLSFSYLNLTIKPNSGLWIFEQLFLLYSCPYRETRLCYAFCLCKPSKLQSCPRQLEPEFHVDLFFFCGGRSHSTKISNVRIFSVLGAFPTVPQML